MSFLKWDEDEDDPAPDQGQFGVGRMTDNKPGYWMYETSGVLRPAIEAYLNNVEMTPGQIAAMRAYLRQWAAGDWAPDEYIDELRKSVDGIASRADIRRWIHAAIEIGIDPL